MTEIFAFFQALDLSWLWSIVQVLQSLGIFWPTVWNGLKFAFYLWCFWVLFVAAMGVYRVHRDGGLKKATTSVFHRGLAMSLVAVAVTVDFISQYTVAPIAFWDWPKKGEHLVTDRLQRYIKTNISPKRVAFAKWLCHLLDPYDPRGYHCIRRSLP
jgi:hypothetical protein